MLGRGSGPAALAGFLFAAALPGQQAAPAEAVQAIFSQYCSSCHGPARMSGLDLRNLTAILKGGKRGPAIVPGHSRDSLLYRAVAGSGDFKMPPGNRTLPPDAVRIIAAWIDAGAPWADEKPAASSWWSFRKPVRPRVPDVNDRAWVRTPVDAFVLATLEKSGLKPAPPADKQTLIRRLYFDLTGLPPAPDDVAVFVADQSPDAYEKLVERLLASPQYGERWGRHWLDVVRYADTSGFESDIYLANAWRYRDYVIQSFNQDKPYDQFVKEQIAADELWPDNNELEGSYILPKQKQIDLERRVGTGMYTVGPFDPSSALDGAQLRYDRLTDMADTTASAFMGFDGLRPLP